MDEVGAEILETSQRLRASLNAIKKGIGLLNGEIAARKRAREERATSVAHSSSDQKQPRIHDSVENCSPSVLLK